MLAYLTDGRSFVVGSAQGQISVWNADTGQPLFEIGHIRAENYAIVPIEGGFLVSIVRVKDGDTDREWLEF